MSEQMTVKLLKKHRHAGRDYPPGAVLDLSKERAQWLVANGVAEKAPASQAAPAAASGDTKQLKK